MTVEVVDTDTGEKLTPPAGFRLSWEPMNAEQALHIKTQINAYSIRLPMLVKEAKEAEAWKALDCATWTEFVEEHLVISTEYARLLLRGADKLEELASQTGIPVDLFAVPERVLRQLDTPTMVGVSSEALADLPADATDAEQADAVAEALSAAAAADRLEQAAERGRKKALADLAAAREHEAKAEAERQQRAADREARKSPEQDSPPSPAAGAPAQSPPVPVHGLGEESGEAVVAAPVDPPGTGGGGATGDPTATVLPDGWRDWFDTAARLLACDPTALGSALTADRRTDAADLIDLFTNALKETP